MELYLQHSDVTAYCGDVLDVLRSLPAESVHCCVTTPPYWVDQPKSTPAAAGQRELFADTNPGRNP